MIEEAKIPEGQGKPSSPATAEFSKMAGAGNDFVIVDNRSGEFPSLEQLARGICTRRLSVGADGLIAVESSLRATFKMVYLNSDGSLADFCANGTRCVARFASLNGIAGEEMTIETGAGIVPAVVKGDRVTLSIPEPHSFVSDRTLTFPDGSSVAGSSITVGVPHYVLFEDGNLWAKEIEQIGRAIRFHGTLEPEGANVNFIRVRDRNHIEIRTYERGVESETLACGSGVVASVTVASLLSLVDSPTNVMTRSGISLDVAFKRGGKEPGVREIELAGDARLVYKGKMTADTVAGFDPEWVRHPTESPFRS